MIEFKLPALGADMDEATLLEWTRQPGEAVRRGDVLAVVDTAKAAVELESWEEGTLFEQLIAPGRKVPVGTTLALLLAPGENSETAVRPELTPPGTVAVAVPAPLAAAPTTAASAAGLPLRASPTARRRAAELGLELASLRGTGPGGVITLADVEAAGPSVTPAPLGRAEALRLSMAAAMSRAKREIPHYYLQDLIPLATALAWLESYNRGHTVTERMLPAVLLLKAVARATAKVPEMNGFYRDGAFQPAPACHLGVAIALRGSGLVAPALHDVADKPLPQLMGELADLVARARAGRLRGSEMSDPTLTVTNLGELGALSVQGIIYPPQVALVGFGRIEARPWVDNGALRIMPAVTISLSGDHRVSDGLRGGLFLAAVRQALQQPEIL